MCVPDGVALLVVVVVVGAQVVYVHFLNSTSNLTRVVARVSQGGTFVDLRAGIAFNVTSIVRGCAARPRSFRSLGLGYCCIAVTMLL